MRLNDFVDLWRRGILLTSVLFFLSTMSLLGLGKDKGMKSNSGKAPVVLIAKIDRVTYKVGQPIVLSATLMNISNDDIYVYTGFEWGVSASISIIFKDVSTKEEVMCGFGDALSIPAKSANDFIKLPPDYQYGKLINIPTKGSQLKPGHRYSLQVKYHSPISNKLSVGVPFLSSEQGEIHAEVIEFTYKK